MCPPGCQEAIRHLGRRSLFKAAGATLAAGAAASLPLRPVRAATAAGPFSRVVDLTHPLTEDFPTYFGEPQVSVEILTRFEQDGLNMKRWSIVEHTGTHMDAPLHFSADGQSADEVPVDRLVVPLAVVDIAARAEENADAQLTPDDLRAWESTHGPLPEGGCVAMHSGWDRHLRSAHFRNVDDKGTLHFPGFHPEAAEMLMERDIAGIAVDTLSLDYGASADFAVHRSWLPSNRWGLEGVASLGGLPPSGATIVVGGPKIVGATGGPCRIFALVA